MENVSAVGSRLGLILIDRGFFSVNSVSEIERLSLEYLMPCPRNGKVKRALNEFATGTLDRISRSDMTNSDRVTGALKTDRVRLEVESLADVE